MRIKLLITASILLMFSGCGEDPEAPTPTLSQEDQDLGRELLDTNRTLNNSGIDTNRFENNLTIGQTNISAIDANGTISSNNSDLNGDVRDIAPTLIDEDIDYINTQFESIYFDYDRYSIKEQMLLTVSKNIQLMNAQQVVGHKIVIQGNCDEHGTDEYNYALGLKRAQVIKETFIAEGVNPERIKVITWGEDNPVCLEQIAECYSKNRRVDFKLER